MDGGIALAVVALLSHAGLRASELTDLSAGDVIVSAKAGQVRIGGGIGIKARFVPLDADAREGVAPWLSVRPTVIAGVRSRAESRGVPAPAWAQDENGPFLVGQRGPFTRRGIGMITEKLGKRAGLAAPLSPHQLRHTFAAAAIDPQGYGLAREPVPLAALQRMMGHAKIETTSVYARVPCEEVVRFLEEEN
jgi:integrase/recombinase XerD